MKKTKEEKHACVRVVLEEVLVIVYGIPHQQLRVWWDVIHGSEVDLIILLEGLQILPFV